MSFKFNWSFFDKEQLYAKCSEVLCETMNKNSVPPVLVEKIRVESLDFGTVAPNLEILEIGDLGSDKFRGIFKLDYSGDAYLSLRTTVEANPLALPFKSMGFIAPPFVSAATSLHLPLKIELSEIKLSAIIIIVYSRTRGLTLVFRNDPLKSVKISSSFDFLPSAAEFLRKEIEEKLRESFLEDIPEVLYQATQNVQEEDPPLFYHHHRQPSFSSPIPTSPKEADAQLPSGTMSPVNPLAQQPTLSFTSLPSVYFAVKGVSALQTCRDTLDLSTSVIAPTLSRATMEAYERSHPKNLPESSPIDKLTLSEIDRYVHSKLNRHSRPKRRVIKMASKSVPSEEHSHLKSASKNLRLEEDSHLKSAAEAVLGAQKMPYYDKLHHSMNIPMSASSSSNASTRSYKLVRVVHSAPPDYSK
ncbi:mitochondrial distribution and morphology protein 34 [Trichomonascus vanleenenianus]|uniref:MDM34 family protein n=1 Tax=Trichomonascus vanleenenianus TaxID=2268995 RepID=UPI003EC9CB54